MQKTEIKNMRVNGRGLQGTIANAKHHALNMLPYINALRENVKYLGFATWSQGHAVHEFITTEGKKFTLRGIADGRKDGLVNYIGVRLSWRESRSIEHRLIDITTVDDVPHLLTAMRMLARPMQGEETGVMQST